MKTKNIVSSALVLSAGGVLAKVFSAVYRIVLTRILGGEGIGLYQLIFPFYSLCVVLASAGIPMAISKIVAKHENDSTILKKCLIFVTIICLALTFILLISCYGLASLQGRKELTACYIILAPSIMLVGVTSVLKGFFQGKHNFIPSAIANVMEQFAKFIVGLILSLSLVKISLIAGIIGAMVSIVISEVIELFVLLIYLKKQTKSNKEKVSISIKQLTKEILPITLTNIILPISSFIDSVLVVNLLNANFSNAISVYLYGLESGAVSSLIGLPTIFSFAIASVILPNIVTIKNAYNRQNKLMLAVKIILIISVPCVLGFAIMPERLITILYGNRLNSFGFDGVKLAGQILAFSGFGVVFLTLNQLFSSSLQALDRSKETIRNLIIAVVVKFVLEIIFIPIKELNIFALAIANTVCYVLVMTLNLYELKQYLYIFIENLFIIKLLLSNCVMLIVLRVILSVNNGVINTILALMGAVVSYFISLFLFKIFNRKEKAMLKYKN